ncbi:hypothetical protein HDV57DRAFT_398569 [Trichoderma longibrachiatum]
MSHPPPPGTNLPARPPAAAAASARPGFRSSFNPSNQPAAAAASPSSYSSASSARAATNVPGYPAANPAAHYGASYPGYPTAAGMSQSTAAYSYPQQLPTYPQQPPQTQGYAASAYSQPQPHQAGRSFQGQSYQAQPYQAAPQYQAQSSYQAAPRIQNPFPTPAAAAATATAAAAAVADPSYDPDMAAQIAQWQSAYGPRETDKDGKPLPVPEYPKPEVVDPAAQADKKKTVVREGGGKKWTDDTLLEWDPSHLRLFVGNLAGETTDESLLKAFSRWKSVQKARVIRDKRTTKSKGYGFVSFSDADDFFQAAKEMHGKYIQSHPVVVKKANTEIKATTIKKKPNGNNKNKKGGHQSGNPGSGSGAGGHELNLGPKSGGGVTKSGQKTKNGLKLLG